MQTVTVKRHDGEKIKMTVDHDGYVDLKRQIAREELPAQTLTAWKDDDSDDGEAVDAGTHNPTATDGKAATEQKSAAGKTAVPPASKPATTGAENPFDPAKGASNK